MNHQSDRRLAECLGAFRPLQKGIIRGPFEWVNCLCPKRIRYLPGDTPAPSIEGIGFSILVLARLAKHGPVRGADITDQCYRNFTIDIDLK